MSTPNGIENCISRLEEKCPNPCGKLTSKKDLRIIHIILLVLGSLDALSVIGFTSDAIVNYIDPFSEDLSYAIVIIINAVFCLIHLFSGIFFMKVFDICTVILTLVLIVAYCLTDIFIKCSNHEEIPDIKYIRFGVLTLISFLAIPCAAIVIERFSETQFEVVGCEYRKLYKWRAFYNSLVMIDLQSAISLLTIELQHGNKLQTSEKWIIGVGTPLAIFWTQFCLFWARGEKKIRMILLEIFGVFFLGYSVWRFYDTFEHNCSLPPATASSVFPTTLLANLTFSSVRGSTKQTTAASQSTTVSSYCFSEKFIFGSTIAAAIFTVTHIVTLVLGIKIILDFGKGLETELNNAYRKELTRQDSSETSLTEEQ